MITTRAALGKQVLVATSRRGFASTATCGVDFTHAVIGGGAVGLAIARKLAQKDGTSTVLIERNEAVGMETSSRNSEVIHAGIYYGQGSLKTKLCIRGKEMMYELCEKYGIPHKRTGKWIVAQTNQQWEELVKLHKFTKSIGVPTHFVSLEEAAKLEPFVRATVGILESPTTGIIDSHAYMQHLLGSFLDHGGDIAYNSTVTSISPTGPPSNTAAAAAGYKITARDKTTHEESSFTASTLVNSSGLGACTVSNLLLPPARHRTPFYAKGNYFSYSASTPRASRLVYPAPEPGLAGLGTHLTLDLSGALRFGPDVEWVDSPDDLAVSTARLHDAVREIRKYLPGVLEERLMPDYAGIRPKLGRTSAVAGADADADVGADADADAAGEKGSAGGKKKKSSSSTSFVDFYIREEEGFPGFVNLLGIESPGLTASLAIADEVEGLLYR